MAAHQSTQTSHDMKAKGRNFVCLTAKPETTKPSKTKPAEKIDGFVSGLSRALSPAFLLSETGKS